MVKELVIAGAKVVQSWVAVTVLRESVSRTFAVADMKMFAFATLLRQCRFFVFAECHLPFAVEHLRERLFMDVAQFISWEYKVVAAIQVTVIFHHAGMTSTLCHSANTRCYACIVGQCGVKQLDEISTYILPHPLVE